AVVAVRPHEPPARRRRALGDAVTGARHQIGERAGLTALERKRGRAQAPSRGEAEAGAARVGTRIGDFLDDEPPPLPVSERADDLLAGRHADARARAPIVTCPP